jgi:hypothetical protein
MSDPPETFADHPESIAEIRSDKTANGADWTPRDALISVLRQIDRGEINPSALIIAYHDRTADKFNFRSACPDLIVGLGLAARFAQRAGADD